MKLLDVQVEANKASNGAPGFAYFMEQGLGKTLTTYADFLERVAKRESTRLLVVCPNSFKAGWVEDAEKHGVDLDFFIWEAGRMDDLRRFMKKQFTKPPCIIVNWEAVRAAKVEKQVRGRKRIFWEPTELILALIEFSNVINGRGFVAWDESVHAATHDSAQTQGGVMIADKYGYSRILSGKPIRQGPHDLWGQLRLIGLMKNRNYYAFKTAFCRMGGFMNKMVIGTQNEDVLAEMIDPFIFRATKKDWTDLPPKLFPPPRVYVMTPEMKAMYKSMEDEFVLWLNSDDNITVDAAITKYIKLAQIQCGWIYDEEGRVIQLVEDKKNPRLNLLKEVLDGIDGKVAIPYNHKPVFDQLMRNLGGEDVCAWIKGQMEPGEIEEQKRRFNTDKSVRYILLQTRAAKYGHTLLGLPEPGHWCRTMVFYENTYSLDDRSQIEDRPHRHGQIADSVDYIDLVGTSMDRNCVRALQRKENIFKAVFEPLRKRTRSPG